jgi:hypothetical protein
MTNYVDWDTKTNNTPQIFPTDAPNQWTPQSSYAYAGKALMGPTPANMSGGRRRSLRRRSKKTRRNRKSRRR